jgi:hypothetical protein
MKHTQGPWYVSSIDNRTIGPFVEAPDSPIPRMQAVCVVKERIGETEANARLIAAAPDLLAALHVALNALGTALEFATEYATGESPEYTEAIECVLAAIEKSTGAP